MYVYENTCASLVATKSWLDYYIYITDIFIKNLSYYASIMLDVFRDLLYSKLCWCNRPGPSQGT